MTLEASRDAVLETTIIPLVGSKVGPLGPNPFFPYFDATPLLKTPQLGPEPCRTDR